MGKGSSDPPAPTFTDPVSGASFYDPASLNVEIARRKAGENTAATAQNKGMYDDAAAHEKAWRGDVGWTPGTSYSTPDTTMNVGLNTSGNFDVGSLGTNLLTAAGNQEATNATNNSGILSIPGVTTYNPYIINDSAAADPNSTFGRAQTSAGDAIRNYFKSQGTSADPYAKEISDLVARESGLVPDLANNIAQYFPTSAGADLYGKLTSDVRSGATDKINAAFAPTYSTDAISDSILNPAVTSAVNSQFDPLSTQLENAYKRGTLNDIGYKAARMKYNTDQTNATSAISKLAQNILTSDRSDIDKIISGAKSDAGGLTLNDASMFDPTKYTASAQSRAQRDIGNFGGDLTSAIGATTFSDLPSLLLAGGQVQGSNDPTIGNPSGSIGPNGQPIGGAGLSPNYIADQINATTKRGLGSQGAF